MSAAWTNVMQHERRRVMALCAILFLRGADANGQPTLAGGGEIIRPGNTISVTSRDSEEARGRLIRISPASLVLDVKGRQREFFVEDIGWVERTGDPLWNGAIIGGLAVATVLTLIFLPALYVAWFRVSEPAPQLSTPAELALSRS